MTIPGGELDGVGTYYSIVDAAAACSCSRDTIKRRRARGAFPNAVRGYGAGPGGPWLIPEQDLVAEGLLRPGATAVPSPERRATANGRTSDRANPELTEVADLRVQLAVARASLQSQARHLQDLRQLLGVTTAAPGSGQPRVPPTEAGSAKAEIGPHAPCHDRPPAGPLVR